MKMLTSLIATACAVLCVSGLTAQEPPVMSLDRRPTYQALTAAGFKLLNPDPAYGNPLQATSYRIEPSRFILGLGEARSAPFEDRDNSSIAFQKHELTLPGTHYPPALPVQDATPIWTLSFDCHYAGLPEARAALASVEKMLKLDMAKVDAWIQHQFWESSPLLKIPATVPDAKAEIQLIYEGTAPARGQEADCRLVFGFQWNAPPDPGSQEGRPPRERRLPPTVPVQPNQPR